MSKGPFVFRLILVVVVVEAVLECCILRLQDSLCSI